MLASRRPLIDELQRLDRRDLELLAVASAPAALAGSVFEAPIERRLSRPGAIAAGLLAGALAMALADRLPEDRSAADAGLADALWLGLGQACALLPGVSRSGATLAAARLRRFTRADASILSSRLSFPVIVGATALKAWRVTHGGSARVPRLPLASGIGASFLSTTLASRVARLPADGGPLWPYALYRAGLAGIICARIVRGRKLG